MKIRKYGTVAVALAVCLVGSACGSSGSSKPTQGTQASGATNTPASNAGAGGGGDCPVTDDDVKGATGAALVATGAPHGGYPGADTCAWYLGDKSGGHTISVTVLRGGRAAFEQTAHAPADSDELQDGSPYESVAGLGTQASASGVGGDLNLDVINGDDWFNVTSFDYPGTDPSRKTSKGLSTDALEACKKVAQAALAKGGS